MTTVVSVENLTKRYRRVTALQDVTFSIAENSVVGLLGRNGAGKTTLLQIVAAQAFETSGSVRVFGRRPHENEAVLPNVSFIKESQRYPDWFSVKQVLASARLMYPAWDEDFARRLLADFALPERRPARKLSRGMVSALGVIIGLASRAPLTVFDEPYLGLDAVARQLFFDQLLADYAEHPRTIVLSTHLIDEVGDLLQRVLLLEHGRLIEDESADTLRERAMTVSGPAHLVDSFGAPYEELHRDSLGNYARATLTGEFWDADRRKAKELGLEVEPVSLQQLIVRKTTRHVATRDALDKEAS